jgi:hypothetical protein
MELEDGIYLFSNVCTPKNQIVEFRRSIKLASSTKLHWIASWLEMSASAAASEKTDEPQDITFRPPRYELDESEKALIHKIQSQQVAMSIPQKLQAIVWHNPFPFVGFAGIANSFVRGVYTMDKPVTTYRFMKLRVNWQAFTLVSLLVGAPVWHFIRDIPSKLMSNDDDSNSKSG